MKKIEYYKEEEELIIELLFDDLRNNIEELVTNIESTTSKKKFQSILITPTLDAISKLQKGGAIRFKKFELAAVLRSIRATDIIFCSEQYRELAKEIFTKTKNLN